jgi:hypothetical protein
VKELQVLLAQRLLAVKDGNFEKEVGQFYSSPDKAIYYCFIIASAEISRS